MIKNFIEAIVIDTILGRRGWLVDQALSGMVPSEYRPPIGVDPDWDAGVPTMHGGPVTGPPLCMLWLTSGPYRSMDLVCPPVGSVPRILFGHPVSDPGGASPIGILFVIRTRPQAPGGCPCHLSVGYRVVHREVPALCWNLPPGVCRFASSKDPLRRLYPGWAAKAMWRSKLQGPIAVLKPKWPLIHGIHPMDWDAPAAVGSLYRGTLPAFASGGNRMGGSRNGGT
jgi:hypothetical protein